MTTRNATATAAAATAIATDPIRTFVVDDSSVVRSFVMKLLRSAPDIVVAGSAADGASAIKQLQGQSVDVVILDIEMPVLDGLAALPQILKATVKPPKVVMASTLTTRGASVSIQALVKGAADYVPKPSSMGDAGADAFARALLDRVRVWGAAVRKERGPSPARMAAPRPRPAAAPPPRRHAATRSARPEALAIACSTGGPQALLRFFAALKGQPLGPVFITQHMPPTFTTLFADQLGRASGRPCHEAVDGELVLADQMYVAPGDYHMRVERGPGGTVVRRVQTPPENFCRPSADPMLRSLADVYGDRLLVAVLTGMGQDGCAGARAVAQKGGGIIAQDEASSVVWGMPGAVAQAGLADEILSLDALAERVAQRFGRPA